MFLKLTILLLLSFLSLFASGDMVKAGLAKLIDKNTILNAKVDNLESRVRHLEKALQLSLDNNLDISKRENRDFMELKIERRKSREVDLKTPFYFQPRKVSFVREQPYALSKKVLFAFHDKTYKIFKIACIKNIGFWGKNKDGWIYISNPKYGKLIDKNNSNVSQNYYKWCK